MGQRLTSLWGWWRGRGERAGGESAPHLTLEGAMLNMSRMKRAA